MIFQKYQFLIPPGKGDSDEAVELLDVPPPKKTELADELTSCHILIDLTLHKGMTVAKKSISAQRVFFIEVIRHLMTIDNKKGRIELAYLFFEAQQKTGNLHLHCNARLSKPQYTSAKILDIKKRILNVFSFDDHGVEVQTIRYLSSRAEYIMKCRTKYPDYFCSLRQSTDNA